MTQLPLQQTAEPESARGAYATGAFEGEPLERPAAPPRIGADAPEILAELGYSSEDVERLIADGVVAQTEWLPVEQQLAAGEI